MTYYSKNTDRMNIHIEEDRKTILIKQKWKYYWLDDRNTSSWTYSEKQEFHKKIDNLIWNNWGQYFYLKVKGNSEFSKKHIKTRWDVNFDIEWVNNNEHWEVNVKKILPNSFKRSNVDWNNKVINLDTEDFKTNKRVKDNLSFYQQPAVHEFGHSIGNSYVFSRGDEYNTSSSYYDDKSSIMNIGNQIRDRHLLYVIKQLNTMIPSTKFNKY